MKNQNEKEQYPINYKIIFDALSENEAENQEIKSLLDENIEINEMRKLILETSEPEFTFDIVSNLHTSENYKITPIYKQS